MSAMGGPRTERKPSPIGPYGNYNQPVYGAQGSSKDAITQKKSSKTRKDSFLDFEKKTIDAWDASDEDLSSLTSVKLSVTGGSSLTKSCLSPTSVSPRQETTGKPLPPSAGNSVARLNSAKDHLSRSTSAPTTPSHLSGHRFVGGNGNRGNALSATYQHATTRSDKFRTILSATSVSLEDLRSASWSGVPPEFRPTAWKLLSGYLPASTERREAMLERKRSEYHNFVERYYEDARRDEISEETYQQIRIDVPRMSPLIPLFQQTVVRDIFERILYIWAIRHPASGYVQGINDLVTPFFVVFLAEYVPEGATVERCQVSSLSPESLQCVEADCFWCFSKLLDGIQDNYTFAQPGIQRRITALGDLVSRIDATLHRHLRRHGIEYLQFSFRWMNNLLMREMPLNCVVRLWDTYLAEPDGFAAFHLYVCAAFLTRFSARLRAEPDFHGLMLLLQNLPTHQWSDDEIGVMLAEAYRLKYTFADAPNHFRDSGVAAGGGGGKEKGK